MAPSATRSAATSTSVWIGHSASTYACSSTVSAGRCAIRGPPSGTLPAGLANSRLRLKPMTPPRPISTTLRTSSLKAGWRFVDPPTTFLEGPRNPADATPGMASLRDLLARGLPHLPLGASVPRPVRHFNSAGVGPPQVAQIPARLDLIEQAGVNELAGRGTPGFGNAVGRNVQALLNAIQAGHAGLAELVFDVVVGFVQLRDVMRIGKRLDRLFAQGFIGLKRVSAGQNRAHVALHNVRVLAQPFVRGRYSRGLDLDTGCRHVQQLVQPHRPSLQRVRRRVYAALDFARADGGQGLGRTARCQKRHPDHKRFV